MEIRLYVGNMSHETTEAEIRTLFSEAGTVGSVDMVMDRKTGKPKGYAFVTMADQTEAEKAISMFDTHEFNSRAIKVNIAQPREVRTGPGGSATQL